MARSPLRLAGTVALAFAVAGCAALPKSGVLFQHTVLLPKGTIPLRAGLTILIDGRPEKERKSLRNISGVTDQVTAVLLKDFHDAEVFNSIEMTDNPSRVDVILKGEIRSFTWRSSWNIIIFLPYVSLVSLFGVPVGKNTGNVGIVLDVVDAKSGRIISSYAKASGDERHYSIYQAADYRVGGGEETSNSFRNVVGELQVAILQDRDRILQGVTPKTTP